MWGLVVLGVVVGLALVYLCLQKKLFDAAGCPEWFRAGLTRCFFIPCFPCTMIGQKRKQSHWYNDLGDNVFLGPRTDRSQLGVSRTGGPATQ